MLEEDDRRHPQAEEIKRQMMAQQHGHGHGGHGHSHGGVPCDGNHGDHGHSHGRPAPQSSHGHSHGGVPCNGDHGGDTQCTNCGASPEQLMRCGRCKGPQYCSKACQVQHWKAGHKATCGK